MPTEKTPGDTFERTKYPAMAPPAEQKMTAVRQWKTQVGSLLPQLGAWLTIALIGGAGIGVLVLLTKGITGANSILQELGDVNCARGLISFIFAIGTIGIAIMLTIGALLGDYESEIFTKAKEILTVLIGVFGTILGFYFGTGVDGKTTDQMKLAISPPSIEYVEDATNLTLFVSGGVAPFSYNIDFDSPSIASIKSKYSIDGWIHESISNVKVTTPVGYKITVIDAKRKTVEYDSPERVKIKNPSQPIQETVKSGKTDRKSRP
jgi:hypothetical protein